MQIAWSFLFTEKSAWMIKTGGYMQKRLERNSMDTIT